MPILSIAILILLSCCETGFDKTDVFIDSDSLTRNNGIIYYRGEKFTGCLYDKYHNETQKSSISFKNGVRHGIAKVWYTNFQLKSIKYYRHGKPVGIHKGYWDTGEKRFLYRYKHGTQHGTQIEWHENGKQRWKATFLKGKPHGNWDEWDDTGLHTGHREYSHGEIVKEEITKDLTDRIKQVSQKRQKLDETVWKEEMTAQKVEEVFTTLWDQLRAASDKFAPFERGDRALSTNTHYVGVSFGIGQDATLFVKSYFQNTP